MIEVRGLSKVYTTGSFTQKALDDVSITFRENEFVAILGPSGSGKTTFLNILGGLDHPDSGEIDINGVSTRDYKSSDWDTYRNHHIGFIFQSYNLIPHQTVLSNVELALTLAGVPRAERRERAKHALERVGLGDHLEKKPNQLSGGQAQRVAIARALVNGPDIVLADEPTGALDTETGYQVMDLLSEIASDRLVVMVTHNPELAYRYADRIVKLADGRITDDSHPVTPEERAALLKEGRGFASASEEAVFSAASSGGAARDASAPQVDDDAASAAPGDAGKAGSSARSTGTAKTAGRKKRASMSFLTALSLSFSNLMTKKGRTFLTAFAASIGIIGIAAILALSNGVNNYIYQVEEETLSSNPLTITKSSFDLTSMLGGSSDGDDDSSGTLSVGAVGSASSSATDSVQDTDAIQERTVVKDMFASVRNNDLKSFKKWLETDGSYVNDYSTAIAYGYGITPIIYTDDADDPKKLNPSAMDEYRNLDNFPEQVSASISMNSFSEMIDNQEVLDSQFEVVKGKWPEKYDECVLVLDSSGEISDYTLYSIGVLDPDELSDMVNRLGKEKEVDTPDTSTTFTYEDALNTKFKVVSPTAFYRHNADKNTWTDMSDDKKFVKKAVQGGTTLKIVGVVKARETASNTALSEGVAYRHDLIEHLMEESADSQIVKEQLAHPKVDVFTGKTFKELKKESAFDMDSLISVDEDVLKDALSTSGSSAADLSSTLGDLGDLDVSSAVSSVDTSQLEKDLKNLPAPKVSSQNVQLTEKQQAQLTSVGKGIMNGYVQYYLSKHQGQQITANTDFTSDFQEYLSQPELQLQLQKVAEKVGGSAQKQIRSAMNDYLENTLQPYLQKKLTRAVKDLSQQIANKMIKQMQTKMTAAISKTMQEQSEQMAERLADALPKAITINLSKRDLQQLLSSMMDDSEVTYSGNLSKLGYAKKSSPESISIYPKDFDNKELVIDAIDAYNDQAKAAGDDDRTITYSDVMGSLISSVTEIVNMISRVLIAFVSISLVVSSIMIGIITYISVLERRKEIGILRAMGASKGNVANIFNAETVIEGLIAGVIAIAVVLLVSIPVNAYVESTSQVPNVMSLPPLAAVILILISVLLTFIAGLIPSVNAARRDPVESLRSE
ncbi:MAG: ATP-binding cassette domain-containing protein [Eggerthellaceae bacterium]